MTRWLKSLGFALAILVGATAHAAEPIKVVYHLSDGVEQAARAMQNIRNHLNADPTAKIAHNKALSWKKILVMILNTNGNLLQNCTLKGTIWPWYYRSFTASYDTLSPAGILMRLSVPYTDNILILVIVILPLTFTDSKTT